LTEPDQTAPKFPDLVNRECPATGPNLRWCGDISEIFTANGKLYLATVIDLYSHRLLAAATSLRCDAELCEQAIKIATTVRGGKDKINNVMFHTASADRPLPPDPSPGSVPCFDNAAAEAFFTSPEWEVLSRHQLLDPDHARAVVLPWCYDFYDHRRRHSGADVMSPIDHENLTVDHPVAA
jgi:transposase InsO family protein